MHLISALAAGIAGAANGTAELYTRGTSTRATYYTDFEGNSANSSMADIDLDANGGATIYVNSTVTVVVKDSDGETVRTFTDGVTASSIEVISDSFTGTDYDDASSGVNKPIALDAVLNKWDDSAGADDWQVLINSTATNISTALAGLSGMFYNVKDPAYGAEGDGSTDDTAAIQAAIDAAEVGGGVVFFPPGTYKITDSLTIENDLTLLGCGINVTIIEFDDGSATSAVDIGNSGATAIQYIKLSGIKFICAQANSNSFIVIASTYAYLIIEECYFDTTNLTGVMLDADTVAPVAVVFTKNTIMIGSVGDELIKVDPSGHFIICHNYIDRSVNNVDTDVISVDGYGVIADNVMILSAALSTTNCVYVAANSRVSLRGNFFAPGAGYAISFADEYDNTYQYVEEGNICTTTGMMYRSALEPGDITSIVASYTKHGSRTDQLGADNYTTGGAKTIDTTSFSSRFVIVNTDASITLNTTYIAPPGSFLTLIFQCLHATPASPTITWGTGFAPAAATFDLSAQYKIKVFNFVSAASDDTGGTVNVLWHETTSTEYDWS